MALVGLIGIINELTNFLELTLLELVIFLDLFVVSEQFKDARKKFLIFKIDQMAVTQPSHKPVIVMNRKMSICGRKWDVMERILVVDDETRSVRSFENMGNLKDMRSRRHMTEWKQLKSAGKKILI